MPTRSFLLLDRIRQLIATPSVSSVSPHQLDEYLALAMIEPTLDLLRKLIGRFCVESA